MKREFLGITGGAVIAVILGAGVFLYGPEYFSDGSLSATASDQQSGLAVSFTPLVQGSHSMVTRRVNYFITSPDELHELWKMVDTTSAPPNIDFKTHAVVAVFAGEQPTTGYRIAVSKIEDSSARLVSITLAKPDSTCMVGQALTTPYEIVVLPTTSLPLTHEDNSVITDCQ